VVVVHVVVILCADVSWQNGIRHTAVTRGMSGSFAVAEAFMLLKCMTDLVMGDVLHCIVPMQGGELAVEDLDKFFKNTWSTLRKHDPSLGKRQLQDQQRPPEQVVLLLQQMGRAHQQLQSQLSVSVQRQLQQRQQGLPERHEGNGQQAGFSRQALQKQQLQHAADAAGNGDVWPPAMQALVAQQLQQQQQQQYWMLQHSLGSMLHDAATHAGMKPDALLKCSTEQLVAVLVRYLSLPQGIAAAAAVEQLQSRLAPPLPAQQQQHFQVASHQQAAQQAQREPAAARLQELDDQQQAASEGASIHGGSRSQANRQQQTQPVAEGDAGPSQTSTAAVGREALQQPAAGEGAAQPLQHRQPSPSQVSPWCLFVKKSSCQGLGLYVRRASTGGKCKGNAVCKLQECDDEGCSGAMSTGQGSCCVCRAS